RPLFGGETCYYRDLSLHFYPQKKYLVEAIRSGELPLWDPYIHGGQPFLGDIQNLVLYPSSLLYFILPVITAFNWDIVLHVMLSAGAAFLLARALGLSPWAAFVTGLIYGFSGFTLSLSNLMY